MPLRWTNIGHRLDDVVFDLKRFADSYGLRTYCSESFDQFRKHSPRDHRLFLLHKCRSAPWCAINKTCVTSLHQYDKQSKTRTKLKILSSLNIKSTFSVMALRHLSLTLHIGSAPVASASASGKLGSISNALLK